MKKVLTIIAAVSVTVGISANAGAQMGTPFTPPTDAMDELNQGSVGNAQAGGNAMDRARNATNQANQRQANQPADPFGAQQQQSPFGPVPGQQQQQPQQGQTPFGQPQAGQFQGQQGQPGQQSQQQTVPTVRAWAGERVLDAQTGEILKDGKQIRVLADFAGGTGGRYYDDGESFNDAVADDNIYTNITISRDRISPQSHVVKTRLIQTLEYMSRLDPMEFFQIRVATTEPLSPLPKVIEQEEKMDNKLREWGEQFLDDYRKDPEEFTSEFIPTFLPPPPKAPNVPLPTNFTPTNPPEGAEGAGQRGFAGGGGQFGRGGVTGEPMGAAGSRYF